MKYSSPLSKEQFAVPRLFADLLEGVSWYRSTSMWTLDDFLPISVRQPRGQARWVNCTPIVIKQNYQRFRTHAPGFSQWKISRKLYVNVNWELRIGYCYLPGLIWVFIIIIIECDQLVQQQQKNSVNCLQSYNRAGDLKKVNKCWFWYDYCRRDWWNVCFCVLFIWRQLLSKSRSKTLEARNAAWLCGYAVPINNKHLTERHYFLTV